MSQLPMQFPVLRMNESHIMRFNSPVELVRMTRKYFELGLFARGTYFIDSLGDKYLLKSVNIKRRSWHISYWFAPSPAIIVDIALEAPIPLTLDEIKENVINLVIKNGWYRQGSETEHSFRSSFVEFQSITQLIDNISFYGEWQG